MGRKYELTTLGCKVNQYESQQIREVMDSLGLQPAGVGEIPDIAVVNTCAVTSTASAKSRQAIRRIARNGYTSVIVVGCGVAADPETIRGIEGVAATLDHSHDVATGLRRLISPPSESHSRPKDSTNDPSNRCSGTKRYDLSMNPLESTARCSDRTSHNLTELSSHSIVSPPDPIVKNGTALTGKITHFAGHQRAFLKVQDGCDAGCTYCIVPQLRPKVMYKSIDSAVAEAHDLISYGHKEIVVTGIFLGAYGRKTAIRKRFEAGPSLLPELVDALAQVEGLKRLRLSSLEPGDVEGPLFDTLARHEVCVPQLHLPLQSGSARILRRMNRQYTLDAFLGMIEKVRSALDRPAITTDIIVGFPGETEDDFRATLEVARQVEFCKIHAFPYSQRERTAAARWKDLFVDPSETRERMGRLAEVERESSLSYRQQFLGQCERVLIEKEAKTEVTGTSQEAVRGDGPLEPLGEYGSDMSSLPKPVYQGRSDRYFQIGFEADYAKPGDLVPVRIDRVTATHTYGSLLPAEAGSELAAVGRQPR